MAKERLDATTAVIDEAILRGQGKQLLKAADKHQPPNWLDGVSRISPAWRGRRDMARVRRTVMAGGYDITESRRTQRDRPRGGEGPADAALDERSLWELRERCRYLDRNSPLMHGLTDRVTDNVTGPEYKFRPNSGDKGFDDEASAMLAERAPRAEWRGLFTLQEIIAKGFRALIPDGDMLMHHLADGTIQAIEGHELVTPHGGKGYKDRTVIGGVELDEKGRHAAYYVCKPDVKRRYRLRGGWVSHYQDVQRIPTAHADHIANRDRFSQTRGVPLMAAGVKALDKVDDYVDSEALAAAINAYQTLVIQREGLTNMPGGQYRIDKNADADTETSYEKGLRLEPGSVLALKPGEEAKMFAGTRPGDQFEPFVVTMLRMIGASIGVPLELLLLDFSKTSYSSARAALLQAYRTFLCHQLYVRNHIIQPIYDRWVRKWIAGRELKNVPATVAATQLEFFPPRWAWIDPLKMVVAKCKQIEAGAGTLDAWVAEEGWDLPVLVEIRAAELELLRQKNVPTTTAPKNLSSKPNAQPEGEKDAA